MIPKNFLPNQGANALQLLTFELLNIEPDEERKKELKKIDRALELLLVPLNRPELCTGKDCLAWYDLFTSIKMLYRKIVTDENRHFAEQWWQEALFLEVVLLELIIDEGSKVVTTEGFCMESARAGDIIDCGMNPWFFISGQIMSRISFLESAARDGDLDEPTQTLCDQMITVLLKQPMEVLGLAA